MKYLKWFLGLGLLVFILVCGAILIGRNFNRPAWQEFSSNDGKFSVIMPGAPKEAASDVGGNNFRSYSCQPQKGLAYTVVYADLSNETLHNDRPDAAGKFLDEACVAFESRFQGELKNARKVALGENPGREVEIAAPGNVYYRVRVFLVKNRYFQVLAQGSKEAVDAEPTTRFFDSFKVPS